MITIDEQVVHAPAAACFEVAGDVERWPDILPHYRWVRFHRADGFARGLVEMAAWRPFLGPVRYPTWWVSEMDHARDPFLIRYRHVRGITTGMDVRWEFHPRDDGATRVRVVHEWDGPRWPPIGGIAASLVIGPVFIRAIAGRTLAGVGAEAERRAALEAERSGGRAEAERRAAVESERPAGPGAGRPAGVPTAERP